jgi:hypothetical protein
MKLTVVILAMLSLSVSTAPVMASVSAGVQKHRHTTHRRHHHHHRRHHHLNEGASVSVQGVSDIV